METIKRRKYTKDFKKDTLELLAKGDRSAPEIERDLDLSQGCISRWKREFANEGIAAFRGQGKLRPYDEEMARLKKENQYLKYERDLLKKAMAIVSREDQR